MLKLKGPNINKLLLYVDTFIFYAICFKTTEKGTCKKEKLKDEPLEVARMRKCAECGSDEEMRWLALHPSLYCRMKG